MTIGVGNEFRHDDAAGLVAARRLCRMGIPADEHDGDLILLADRWSGADGLILIDAVSSGAPAGTIHRLDISQVPLSVGGFRGSTHAFSLADTIELSRNLGKLPSYVLVFGIEGTDFSAGIGMSDHVERSVDIVVNEIEEIRGLTGN